MTKQFKLGSRVSLSAKIGSKVEATSYFVVASDGIMDNGKYFLVYHDGENVLTTTAEPESLIFEKPPVKWKRGCTAPLWSIGYYRLNKSILIGSTGDGDGFRLLLFVVDNRETGTSRTGDFIHPDDFNGVLEFGQRVIVQGQIGYVVKGGPDWYDVAFPPSGNVDDHTKYLDIVQLVEEKDIEEISPSFKPARCPSEDYSFGDIVAYRARRVLALGPAYDAELNYVTKRMVPLLTPDGEIRVGMNDT